MAAQRYAMTTVPTKIVLKSTTRMSLNDRFSSLQHQPPTAQSLRANAAAEHQVSAANRRLAQQLANRPTLQQAGGDAGYMMGQQPQGAGRMRGQQRPLQQRLGRGNIKNRLSLPQPIRGRGRSRGRGNLQAVTNQRGRGGANANFNKNYSNNTTYVPRGMRGRGGVRGRGRGNYNRLTGQNTTVVRRGGRGNNNRGYRGRGGRGGRGLGRQQQSSVSQQDLDAQLDSYMAKTKSSLDSELDSYMAEVST